MKYRVKSQHYDMLPGTVVYKTGVSDSDTRLYGVEYFLVTEIEGDTSEGSLRVIPKSKLEKCNE
jgi:hypothetical protein